jgi:hypothetical protein
MRTLSCRRLTLLAAALFLSAILLANPAAGKLDADTPSPNIYPHNSLSVAGSTSLESPPAINPDETRRRASMHRAHGPISLAED